MAREPRRPGRAGSPASGGRWRGDNKLWIRKGGVGAAVEGGQPLAGVENKAAAAMSMGKKKKRKGRRWI